MKRYDYINIDGKGDIVETPEGEFVLYSEMQTYIKNLIETISIPWNIMLTSGGALNETSGKED